MEVKSVGWFKIVGHEYETTRSFKKSFVLYLGKCETLLIRGIHDLDQSTSRGLTKQC